MQLFRKILSGMANSVNPDRTLKEQSDLSLHCSYMPFCQKHWCTIFGPLPQKKKKKKSFGTDKSWSYKWIGFNFVWS